MNATTHTPDMRPQTERDRAMLLQDKTIIVTGGNSGIGEAIVVAAAAAGANIVIDYVARAEVTSALVARIEAAGGKAVGVN